MPQIASFHIGNHDGSLSMSFGEEDAMAVEDVGMAQLAHDDGLSQKIEQIFRRIRIGQ